MLFSYMSDSTMIFSFVDFNKKEIKKKLSWILKKTFLPSCLAKIGYGRDKFGAKF